MHLIDIANSDLATGRLSLYTVQGRRLRELKYAMLSHRLGPEEVLYEDVLHQTANTKAGYNKLTGAIQKASKHGYAYLWVDTCCINKDSSAELSEAINSMYKWYENTAVCYAYLVDVDVA
jgi:hypothetical protein